MQKSDCRLTNALGVVAIDDKLGKTTFAEQLARLQRHKKKKKKFAHPGLQRDKLFRAGYHHKGGSASKRAECCDQGELVERPQRTEEGQQTLVFHRGRIAMGNAVVKDGELRDRIGARCGALRVQMEAAGVDANRR
ncbi:hypothetical protein E8E13_000920 [Curvularia kusanoi]|uniref:Uncharacterized protein n=1 Tax=Curvularia kusanoi TaxID=90978 RepID=A0A9P4W6N8_CURKU|nr:hypothetical protein E8E13_000920 [Curvularia kusanoi]